MDIADNYKKSEPYPIVECRDLFSDIDDLSESDLQMIEAGGCLDPDSATLEGTETYKDKLQRIDTFLTKNTDESGQALQLFYSFYIFDA